MTHNPAEALRKIADEIFERWDKDQRSGKLLTALAGRLPGYRADVDTVLATLTSPAPAGGEVTEALADARRHANHLILAASDGSESYTDYQASKGLEDALRVVERSLAALNPKEKA